MSDRPVVLERNRDIPDFARGTVNLASARLGAKGIYSTDEFFAPLERMLKDDPAVFLPGEYDENGKWMDGWESRRKRVPGHDWAVVRLAMPGRIFGFDIDTSHFTGNFPPHCAIEAAFVPEGDPSPDDDEIEWTELLTRTPLGPDQHHFRRISDQSMREKVWSHIRVHIYPDGGIARLRVYGAAFFDWKKVAPDEEIDLAYVFHGGRAIAWSDAHYGSPERILGPGRGVNMGDGWETARRRGPGYDWTILKLGHPGVITRIVLDTAHFKGNFPNSCELLGAWMPGHVGNFRDSEIKKSEAWMPLLTMQKLKAHHIHEFVAPAIVTGSPVTHVRLNIHPDGGVSRLRLYGRKA